MRNGTVTVTDALSAPSGLIHVIVYVVVSVGENSLLPELGGTGMSPDHPPEAVQPVSASSIFCTNHFIVVIPPCTMTFGTASIVTPGDGIDIVTVTEE